MGQCGCKIRKAKCTIPATRILFSVWLILEWANRAGRAKTWLTGFNRSCLCHWGGWGWVKTAARSEKQKALYQLLGFCSGFGWAKGCSNGPGGLKHDRLDSRGVVQYNFFYFHFPDIINF